MTDTFASGGCRFAVLLSAADEYHGCAEFLRERLCESAGPDLEVELTTPSETAEASLRGADLLLLFAPRPEDVTAECVFQAGYARGRDVPVVYLYEGDEPHEGLAADHVVRGETAELFEFFRTLLVHTESFGAERPLNSQVLDVIVRRLAAEVHEQMPSEQARYGLRDVLALASRVASEVLQPFADLDRRPLRPRESQRLHRQLRGAIERLERDIYTDGYLHSGAIERLFVSEADRQQVRRLFARWSQLRAQLFDSLAAEDFPALAEQLRAGATLHGEFLALAATRQCVLGGARPRLRVAA